MSSYPNCPQGYWPNPQTMACQHFILPLSLPTILGFIMTFIVAGFSSLAGVGGGTPHLVAIMILYNYTPKHSTIVVFCCILGTTLGNVLSQMRLKINSQPIIQYQYAFISIPILFMGSIIGVLLNKFFPSIAICAFIMYWAIVSVKGIYQKFVASYKKETQENQNDKGDNMMDRYVQTQFNPLECPKYRHIFKVLACLFALFIGLALIKGTQKLDSVVGIQRCSMLYWGLYLLTFVSMGLFSCFNLQTLKSWQLKPALLSDQTTSTSNNVVEDNISFVTRMSCMAGLFSGMGLGGGIFLIPMYKSLGCNGIQAAATCAFTVFSSSLLNVIQGSMLGLIGLSDFLTLFTISILGSFVCSTYISKYLQRINRVSLVEGALLVLVLVAIINLPFSLYLKYARSGYNNNLLFGFGSFC